MFERILLVLDGSRAAEKAVPYAESLARAFRSRLMLLLALEAERDREDYIERVSGDIAGALGQTKTRPARVVGEPAGGIARYAAENNIDLVVMATHTRSGILVWPLGNIAMRVLEGVSMPVLGVKDQDRFPDPLFSRIMVLLDGSKPGEAALPHAAGLARKLKAELVLAQVVEAGDPARDTGGPPYVNFAPESPDRILAEARAYLWEVSKSLVGVRRIRVEVKTGQPQRDVVRLAAEVGADLVAVSTQGGSPRGEAFGTIFRKTFQAGRTHILAVRPSA